VIDSEEYREGTYEKLDNWYPVGVFAENRRKITIYLWYNGSTSFVNGEKLKREREDRVKSKGQKVTKRWIPMAKTRNVVSYSWPGWSVCNNIWRAEPVFVVKTLDELWIGVKG